MAGKIIEKALRGATGKPARRIKQKPSEALRTDNVTETAEGSASRAKLAKVGGATKGRSSTLVNKLVAFDKITDKKSGVLVKFPKKKQDLRIDLPTIGLKTLKQSKLAGLKGLVLKSKQNVFLDKNKCVNFANKNKMFIKVK